VEISQLTDLEIIRERRKAQSDLNLINLNVPEKKQFLEGANTDPTWRKLEKSTHYILDNLASRGRRGNKASASIIDSKNYARSLKKLISDHRFAEFPELT